MTNELFPEKQDVLGRVIEHLEEREAGYICVPTGWGKTFLTKHLMRYYRDNGKNAVFSVFSNNALLEQTFADDEIAPADFMIYGEAPKPSMSELEDALNSGQGTITGVTVDTITKSWNQDLKKTLLDYADLLVVDEIHNYINNTGNTFIEDALQSGTHVFGMTATPMQGVVGRLKFVEQISPKMNEIWSKSLADCLCDRDLSDMEYYAIRSPLQASEIYGADTLEKALQSASDHMLTIKADTLDEIDRLLRRTRLAVDAYRQMIQGGKTLVFCARTQTEVTGGNEESIQAFHSKLTAAQFNDEVTGRLSLDYEFDNYRSDGGLKRAAFLSGELSPAEKKEIIDGFKDLDSNPEILCTVEMLIEGFDFPELKQLILLRPTLSPRLFVQQIGRVLRPRPPGKSARVFEVSDRTETMMDHLDTKDYEHQTWVSSLMLDPESRLEMVVGENGDYRAFKQHVSLFDLVLDHSVEEWNARVRPLLPISKRANRVEMLLAYIRGINKGEDSILKGRARLFKALSGLSALSVEDVRHIAKIMERIEDEQVLTETQQGINKRAQRLKMDTLKAAKWFATCRTIYSIVRPESSLDTEETKDALRLLGYSQSDSVTIREQCFKKGRKMSGLSSLKTRVSRATKFVRKDRWFGGAHTRPSYNHGRLKKQRKTLCEDLLWLECFSDMEDMRDMLENSLATLREKSISCGPGW